MTIQKPFSRRVGLALILTIFLILTQVMVVNAGIREGLHFTVGCTGFTTNDGGVILNRDNTGAGSELVYITATDGVGNLLYMSQEMTFLVGGRLYFGAGTMFEWASASAFNPTTVSVISPAGNGLDEQIVYAANGYCSDLPTIAEDGTVIAAETSPTVPLNVLPPEGVNPENYGQLEVGYLLVNASWLNVRSGDSIKYTIVGRVAGAAELTVLGVNEARTWWYIEAGDVLGWVSNEHVFNRGDLSDVPVVVALGEIAQVRFFTYLDVQLWGLPGRGGGVLCMIDGNKEYFVVGQSASGLSISIEADCNGAMVTGWVPAEEGAIRNSGNVPIPVIYQQ
jgi:hypothetical protein